MSAIGVSSNRGSPIVATPVSVVEPASSLGAPGAHADERLSRRAGSSISPEMLVARLIEGLVFALTAGSSLFVLYLLTDLLRLRGENRGPVYRGGIGQWSWAAHRITGVLVVAFLFGHIVDTFGVGFGPELYNETISLYQQWWFKPFEVALIAATLYHALNGLRIILFDFWPNLALRQRQFALAELVLFAVGFAPAAFFMLRSAWTASPFS
jgi:succinate dehydrogenase / fumarate reductase, cytochrome b subunit